MLYNCVPLIADLIFYCYVSVYDKNSKTYEPDLVKKFNITLRYLDDILALSNPEFQKFANKIYPKKLNLNKSNTSYDRTPFVNLNLKI